MATPSGRTSLQTSEASPSDPLDRSYGAGVGLRRGHRVAVGADEAGFGRCVGEAGGRCGSRHSGFSSDPRPAKSHRSVIPVAPLSRIIISGSFKIACLTKLMVV